MCELFIRLNTSGGLLWTRHWTSKVPGSLGGLSPELLWRLMVLHGVTYEISHKEVHTQSPFIKKTPLCNVKRSKHNCRPSQTCPFSSRNCATLTRHLGPFTEASRQDDAAKKGFYYWNSPASIWYRQQQHCLSPVSISISISRRQFVCSLVNMTSVFDTLHPILRDRVPRALLMQRNCYTSNRFNELFKLVS